MKKSIIALLVAILAVSSVSTFALTTGDTATAIKKAATNGIKNFEKDPKALDEIVDLLGKLNTVDAKQQAVILNAIKAALNTATLKKQAPAAVDKINAAGSVLITKAAGGKYNISVIDTTTGTVTKQDIPKAAVEKPTLSTNPAANN